ncbi:unnamed protein product [Rhizoctonia solani]|uniref:FYVE-type domain-containing protein n=1 Tax=Rhizoctonia solani TaxID=456999 RepID=A0A8H3GGP5_9AGAM|nr:unnamed protein product [Rhizoctonia solani]
MNGTAPVTVSYRPYQSKRHARTSSALGNSAGFSPPVTPPAARSPGPFDSPSTPEHRVYGNAKHLIPPHPQTPAIVSVPSRSSPSPSPSPSPTTPEATIQITYKPESVESKSPDTQALPTPSPTPEQATSSESSSQPSSPLTQLPALPASETAGPSSPGPSSPTSSTAASPRSAITQRPGSRFRVVSTRGPNASTQPARPSPLRPASHLSPGSTAPAYPRRLSNASTPVSPSPVARIPTSASAPVALDARLSPAIRNKPLPPVVAPPSLTPPRSNTPTTAPPRSTTPVLAPAPVPPRSTTPVVAPTPTSNTPVPYAVLSRPSSASPSPANTPGGSASSRPAPYRAGFQPKGVYRHRTEEFEAARAKKIDGKRTEEKRLTRRLEKLIDLHFSPKEKDAPPPRTRRTSSFFDELTDIKNRSANELWRGVVDVVESKAAQQERAIRTAEQSITKWEEDKDVSACPICITSFHPLTNRKHHCRLCGRIVCSLPPKPPTRPVSCSLLIVADPRTRKIDEVPDVIAYGVTLDGEKESKYVKGVRICRTCRAVVTKQQYNVEAAIVPTFSRFYQAMLRLEGQIEDDLPQFQELVLNLKNGVHSNASTSTTAAARKSLLDRFHEYDRLAKRLRALPCQPGGSQEKVQIAVATRASVFLQKHMFPLQTLPKMKQLAKAATESEVAEPLPVLDDPGHVIQPLLEQEAVLEQMLAEAQAARKIEDALTLKSNLAEIRNEIRRMMG